MKLVSCKGLVIGGKYVIRGKPFKVKNEGRLCVLVENYFHVFPQKLKFQNSVNASFSDKVKIRYCDNNFIGYAKPSWLVLL